MQETRIYMKTKEGDYSKRVHIRTGRISRSIKTFTTDERLCVLPEVLINVVIVSPA